MRKIRRFIVNPQCTIMNSSDLKTVSGGTQGSNTCNFHSSQSQCNSDCSEGGFHGSCVYGTISGFSGCYCVID